MPTSTAVVAPSARNSTDLKSRDFIAASLVATFEFAIGRSDQRSGCFALYGRCKDM